MRKLTATLCLTLAVLLGSEVEGSDLPVCDGSPKEARTAADIAEWDNCQGTITLAGGAKYVGEFSNGKFHGQGTLTDPDGNKYVGEFRNDKFHGQGTLAMPVGAKYVGEFRDNVPHGQGTATYADGRVKSGTFINGEYFGE